MPIRHRGAGLYVLVIILANINTSSGLQCKEARAYAGITGKKKTNSRHAGIGLGAAVYWPRK